MTVTSLLKRLADIMRSDQGIDGTPQRLSQIVWLLFLMVFDLKEEEAELVEDEYEPVIPEGFRWRDWAVGESAKDQLTGDELLDFVNNKLIPVLRGNPVKDDDGNDVVLFASESPQALLVKEFMGRTHNYAQNGYQLRQVLNALSEVDLTDPEETHEFNDIYETMLKDLQGAGKAGEFYTPRAVTKFGIKHVAPRIGETVGDFSCGTGGFLVDALDYLEGQIEPGDVDAYNAIQHSLVGQEWKPMPYMLAVTNLMLHDIKMPNITYGDSLVRKLSSYEDEDLVDVIAMNPPYGGVSTEANKQAVSPEFRSSETADLFLALIMERLKKGGRAVVVLPNGFLEGEDNVRIALKKKLLRDFNLHTVIRLPESVFSPYTSIETNLLFFDKDRGGTKGTWFYRFDKPEGYKHFSKTRPLLPKHMDVIDEWWENRTELTDEGGNQKAVMLTPDQIAERNYNLNVCDYPHEVNEVLPPEELIPAYKAERARLDKAIDEQLAAICALIGLEVE